MKNACNCTNINTSASAKNMAVTACDEDPANNTNPNRTQIGAAGIYQD
jgi:hypothetical protein